MTEVCINNKLMKDSLQSVAYINTISYIKQFQVAE